MDNYHTLNQLQDELKEKYPQLRINRDSGMTGEFLLIYQDAQKLAQLEIKNQSGEIQLIFTAESPKPEIFSAFPKAKTRLNDWLKKQLG
ncbi:MAG: hypothetical protein MUE54_14055 [Anaerolineae bacterium]|jgi:hypothetical protein|nr:hypothetical protein [Anaerolineae bacterium]